MRQSPLKGPGGSRLDAIDTTIEDWKLVFQINFFAPMVLAGPARRID
jgi:hypothetical protein